MSACPALSDFIPANSISVNGKVTGTKDDSYVLPVMAWWRFGSDPKEFWDRKEILAGDLDNKNVGQGLCVTVDAKAGSEYPDGDRVLEAFKASLFIRTSTVVARRCYKDKDTGEFRPHFKPLKRKYAFQIDCDDCTREQLDGMIALAQKLGANGYVAREKKPGHWSCNITFFMSNGYFKEWAKGIALEVAELFRQETGAEICKEGTQNDLIKNPWAVRRIVELSNLDMHLEGRMERNLGPRNGLIDTNLWAQVVEGKMTPSAVLNSEVEIWKEQSIGTWEMLRGKIEEMRDVDEEEERENRECRNETSSDIHSEIQADQNPSTFVPPIPKTLKTPFEWFPDYGKKRHDTISVLWKPDLRACWREHGFLPKDEFMTIYRKWELVAGEMTGKGSYGRKGLAWAERDRKSLNNKKPAWLSKNESGIDPRTLRNVAGKILRTAKLAIDLNIDSRIKEAAEIVLARPEVMDNFYLQTKMSKKVSRTTEWRYKQLIEDDVRLLVMMEDILDERGETKGENEKLLFEVLREMKKLMAKRGIKPERKECRNETCSIGTGKRECRNETFFFNQVQERLETLKTQAGGSFNYGDLQSNWTAEDEKWVHVEKVDSFNHLNTDLENRMMGRDYIRDAERYHTEGLFGLRDEAVQAARSCGYIGGFSWESKHISLDWGGIHDKVFKTEDTHKEPKALKTTVSFADIRARLNRMKGAGDT